MMNATTASYQSKRSSLDTARKNVKIQKGKVNAKPKYNAKKRSFSQEGHRHPSGHTVKHARRHADAVEEAKSIWNKLRMKSNSSDENRRLVDQLSPLVVGKAKEIALQHDASRCLQAVIQFGTPSNRRQILTELCQKQQEALPSSTNSSCSFVDLCKSQYAHFVVLKVITYCCQDPECVSLVMKQLKSHMVKLAVHSFGSRVIEQLFRKFPAKETAILKQEFYGPHFTLFASDTLREQAPKIPTLSSIIETFPEKKDMTIDFARNVVQKALEKKLFGLSYVHSLLDEFLQVAPAQEIRTLADSAAADACIHMVSTKAGTRAVANLIAYGNAKDRKRIAKSLKGYSRNGLLHHDAYLAILRLVQLTDDTVSIHKIILQELMSPPAPATYLEKIDNEKGSVSSPSSPLLDLALSTTASKLFLMLLAEKDDTRSKFLDPYEHSILSPNPPFIMENGESVPTSKKDPQMRRSELLEYLYTPLLELCSIHAEVLMRSIPGGLVLREAYAAAIKAASAASPSLAMRGSCKIGEEHKAMVTALVNLTFSALTDSSGSSITQDRKALRTIKHLLLVDASSSIPVDDEEGKENTIFANGLLHKIVSEGGGSSAIAEILHSNQGSFVLATLCKTPAVRSSVLQLVKPHKKEIEKLVKEGEKSAVSGYTALLNEMSGKN